MQDEENLYSPYEPVGVFAFFLSSVPYIFEASLFSPLVYVRITLEDPCGIVPFCLLQILFFFQPLQPSRSFLSQSFIRRVCFACVC